MLLEMQKISKNFVIIADFYQYFSNCYLLLLLSFTDLYRNIFTEIYTGILEKSFNIYKFLHQWQQIIGLMNFLLFW